MVIRGIKTPGSNEQAGVVSKYILNALRGSTVQFMNADGEKQNATVDEKGNLIPVR